MLICYIYLSLDLYTSLHTLGWPLAFIINPQSYYLEEKKEKKKTAKENQKSISKTEINSVKSKIVDVQKSVLFTE